MMSLLRIAASVTMSSAGKTALTLQSLTICVDRVQHVDEDGNTQQPGMPFCLWPSHFQSLQSIVEKIKADVIQKVKTVKKGTKRQLNTAGGATIVQLINELRCGTLTADRKKRALCMTLPVDDLSRFGCTLDKAYPGSNKRRKVSMQGNVDIQYFPRTRRFVLSSEFSAGETGSGGKLVSEPGAANSGKLSTTMKKKRDAWR